MGRGVCGEVCPHGIKLRFDLTISYMSPVYMGAMDHFYTELECSYKRACSSSFLEEFFSETGGRTLLSLVLYCTHLTAPAKCFRTCDKGAQPYAARGKAANHVAKVVHP